MNTQYITHQFSASQYVRIQNRAKELGKTVEDYLTSFLTERVGTTSHELQQEAKLLSA